MRCIQRRKAHTSVEILVYHYSTSPRENHVVESALWYLNLSLMRIHQNAIITRKMRVRPGPRIPKTNNIGAPSTSSISPSPNPHDSDFFLLPTKRILLSLLGILGNILLASCQGPPESVTLATKLETRIAELDGEVGLYVHHLKKDHSVLINADELFPAASLIKVPILASLLNKVERGDLGYQDKLIYTKDRLYPGEDLLGSFANNEKLTLKKLVFLMITTSDNTASLWCQELAGTGTTINTWLKQKGFLHTRLNSRTPGRADARDRYGWGQTTPREMAQLLIRIRNRKLVSSAADEEMARIMGRSYWDGEAISSVPPSVSTMSKQGAVNASRSEVVLVHAPHGDYVFCVITKNQKDQSWKHGNEGFSLLRDISRILWEHFEPQQPYLPASGNEQFR